MTTGYRCRYMSVFVDFGAGISTPRRDICTVRRIAFPPNREFP
jgi:hypothetical protein